MADNSSTSSGSRYGVDSDNGRAADSDAYLAGIIAQMAHASLGSSSESSIDSRDNTIKLVGGARIVPPLPGGGLEDDGQQVVGSLPGSPVRRSAGGTVRSPIRSPTVPKNGSGDDRSSSNEPSGYADADGSDSAGSAASDGSEGVGRSAGSGALAARGSARGPTPPELDVEAAKKADEALHSAEAKLQPVISQAATWRTAASGQAGVLVYTLFNFERPQVTSPMVEHWCQADANLQALTDVVTRPVDKAMHAGAGPTGQVALAAAAVGIVRKGGPSLQAPSSEGLNVSAYGIQAFAVKAAADYGLLGAEHRSQSVYSHTISRLQRLAGAQHAGQGTPMSSARAGEGGGAPSARSTPSREHSALTLHGDGPDADALSAELSHALVEIVPKSGQRGVHIHDSDTELSFPLGIAAAQAAAFAAAVSDLHNLPDILSMRLAKHKGGDVTSGGLRSVDSETGTGSGAVSPLHPRMEQEIQALEDMEVHSIMEGEDARLPSQAEVLNAVASERAAVKRSFRVIRVLAGGTPLADELMSSRTDEIARAAFSVFSTRSKGSPSHACVLLQRLIQVQPERAARLIASDSQRYIGAMLPYLHHSPVADCLVQLVTLSHLHSSWGGAGPCADLSGGFRNASPFGAEPFGGMGGGLYGMSGAMAREKGMTNFDGTLPLYCTRGVPATPASRFKLWQSLASWGFLHVLASHVYAPEYGPCPEHIGNAADALMQIVRTVAADDRGDLLLRPLGRVGCMQGGMLQGLLLGAVAPLPGIDHAPGEYCADGTVPARQTCCMRVMNELLTLSYADTVPASGEPGAAPQAAAPQVPGATVKQVENRVHKYAQSISSAVVAALPRLGAALARVHKVLHPQISLVQGKASVGSGGSSKGGTAGAGTVGGGSEAGTAADADKKKQKKKDKKKKKKAKEAAAAAVAAPSTGGATGASTATAGEGSDVDSDEEGDGTHDKAGDSKGTPSAPTTPVTAGAHPSGLPHTSSSASMVPHAAAGGAHAHHGLCPPASPTAGAAQLHPGHIYSAPFGTFRLNAAQLVAAVVARRETSIPKPEPLPRPPVLTDLLGGTGTGADGSHSAGFLASPNSTTDGGTRDRATSAVGAESVSGTEGGQRLRGESVVSASEAAGGAGSSAAHGPGGKGGTVARSASSTPHGSHDGDHEDNSDDEDEHDGGKVKGGKGGGKGKKGKKAKGKGKGNRYSTGSAQGRARSSSNVSGDSHEHVEHGPVGGKAGGKGSSKAGGHHSHAKKLAIESDDEVDEMVTVSAAALDALSTPALLVPAAVLAVQLQQSQASGSAGSAASPSVPGQLLPSVYEPADFTGCLVAWVGLYSHTNMYHLAFYAIMQGILLARHEASLSLLFKGSKLLSTFIGHYEATALGQHASAHRVLGPTGASGGSSGEDGARERSGSSTVTSSDGTLIMRMDMPLSPVGKGGAGTARGGPGGVNATGGKKDAVVTVVTADSIKKADAARKPYTPRSREQNGSGARGTILKTLNTVRLVAQSEPPTSFLSQHLRDHSKWAEFQPKLKEETLSLSKPLVPAPTRPGPNGPGSPGLSNMSANMSALLKNMLNPSSYNNLLSQVSSQGGSLLNKLKGGSSPSSPSSSSVSAASALVEDDSVLGLGSSLAKELGLGNLKPYVPDTAAVPAAHSAAGAGGIGGLLASGKAAAAGKGAKARSSSVSSTSSSGSTGSALSLMSEGGQEAPAAAGKPVVAKATAAAAGAVKKAGVPIKAGQALAAALSGVLPPSVPGYASPSGSKEKGNAGGLHDVD